MTDPLTRLLVDVCLDADRLDAVRADPRGALASAGVSRELSSLVEQRRGSFISLAVALARPLPSAAELATYARARSAEDPAFAEQIRREPRPILERAFQVRFHRSTTFRVTERDGLPELHVDGLMQVRPTIDAAVLDITAQDVDIDTDVDVDVDIDVDVDVDIDALVVVDVDVDIDVDIDTDIDTVTVTNHEHQNTTAWTATWARKRARWHAADDRRTPV